MSWFSRIWGESFNTKDYKRDEDGMFLIYSMANGVSPEFNNYAAEVEKVRIALTNPAFLKVLTLQCDLFSLGQLYVYDGDKRIDKDPILDMLKRPNYFQPQSQWLWDLMFYQMIHTARCYVDSDVVSTDNNLYFLDPAKTEIPDELKKGKDKVVLAQKTFNELQRAQITYKYADGSTWKFPYSRITSAFDLTNGNGNWFQSNSRIDALYKIISNSEAALDADNINIRYTGKFMVAGQADPKDTSKIPLGDDEKKDIETKMNGRKSVHAVKSMIDIKRFVEDRRSLELGKAYTEAYYLIGGMYNIPKDVLEAYLEKGSTFENKEKAVSGHVSYSLQPKGNAFFELIADRFGYTQRGLSVIMSWDHLPFMQVFEKDKSTVELNKVQSMTGLLKLGVGLDEINKFLDTDFKTGKYEQPKPSTNAGSNQGNQGKGNS